MKPRMVTIIRYECGKPDCRHRTKEAAIRCMEKAASAAAWADGIAREQERQQETAGPPFSERTEAIRLYRQVGLTYARIGAKYGISANRARQILVKSEREIQRWARREDEQHRRDLSVLAGKA